MTIKKEAPSRTTLGVDLLGLHGGSTVIVPQSDPFVDPASRRAHLLRKVERARRPALPGQVEALRRLSYSDPVVSELHGDELLATLLARGGVA